MCKFICTTNDPVVTTKQGKIRGFWFDGLYTFYGIPYAAAERFQMPHDAEPWEGVKEATSYGYVCPLMTQDRPENELLVPHRYWPMDEKCQNLNLWTPSLDPEAKKPVMVWFHGGGFHAGSAIEQVAYEGDHLSKYGDVVVVTVNHRLNILGYLDLSFLGEKYANSANVGNGDLVAALQWIRDNIAAFGGDPENVTVFGQSGGGEKVICLMNTPAADGLFHKAIIQSGVIDLDSDAPANGEPIVLGMLEELGLSRSEAEQLETIPYGTLAAAYKAAAQKVIKAGGYIGCWPSPNGWYKGNPRKVGFTEHAKSIPVLIGTVMGEFCFEPGVRDKYDLDEAQIMELLEEKYGDDARPLAEQFAAAYPGKNLTDLLYVDTYFRIPTKAFIQKRMEQAAAPTYAYLFAYDFPIEGGKVAWHCSEIPFVFHNTDRAPLFNVPGETDRLEEQICSAFVNFARYGSPDTPVLPQWPPCAAGEEATMILDRQCQVRCNHDDELIRSLEKKGLGAKVRLEDMIVESEENGVPGIRH